MTSAKVHPFLLTLRSSLLALLMLPAFLVQAQSFDVWGELYDQYAQAHDQNEQHQYLKAYRAICTVQNRMQQAIQTAGNQPATIDYSFFDRCYWPIVKSRAEIAYALGIHADMTRASAELSAALTARYQQERPRNEMAQQREYQADLAKIDGGAAFLLGHYPESETHMRRAVSLMEQKNPLSPKLVAMRSDLAQALYAQGKYQEALLQLDTLLASQQLSAANRDPSARDQLLDIRSQHAICLARLQRFAQAQAEIDSVVTLTLSDRTSRSHAEALRKKGKILMLQQETTGTYAPAAATLYSDYLSVARRYVDTHFLEMDESQREQFWMAEQPFVTDCYRLEDKAPAMLYDVALFSKAVLLQLGRDFTPDMTPAQRKAALASVRIKWQTVKAHLPQSAAAIEFIAYDKGEQPHLAALVLTRTAKSPVFVPIVPVHDLLSQKLSDGSTVQEALLSPDPSQHNVLYTDTLLPTRIWTPQLVKAIGANRHVYFAADGIFHQLAIEYLLPSALDDRQIHRLTTTRLLAESRRPVRTSSMLICGGVDYSYAHSSNISAPADTLVNDPQAYALISAKGIGLAYLPASRQEADSVYRLRHSSADLMLQGDNVTEAALRQLMNRYHILQISTHGLFTEAAHASTDLAPMSSDTQLSQSCLFLSGAQRNLSALAFDSTQPDGILSARELSATDLSQVDLAVLSACQSGLGQLTVDGIFGLQRGLKTAGVRAIIASLWEVDDKGTLNFMLHLHLHLQAGASLHEAFQQARHQLRTLKVTTTYPRGGGRSPIVRTKSYGDPNYYDAFILIDAL